MSKLTLLLAGLALFGASGCSFDPRSFETAPVDVATAQGSVTCQLYTKERVIWDRAINRPETMSVEEADAVCRAEGYRQLSQP